MAVQSVTFQTPIPGAQSFPERTSPSQTLLSYSGKGDQVTFGCGSHGGDDEKAKTNFKPRTVQLWDKNLGFFTNVALFPIGVYQYFTRGREGHTVLGKLISAKCPYNPSCSEYTAESIKKNGPIKGWLQGMYRVGVKCNPLYFAYRHFRYGEPMLADPRSIEDPVK